MRGQLVRHAIKMGVKAAAAFDITILSVNQWRNRLDLHGQLGHGYDGYAHV